MWLPLLELVWLMLLPMLWLMLLALLILADVVPYCCTIDTLVAEGTVVPVADVIATIDFNLADVIVKGQME